MELKEFQKRIVGEVKEFLEHLKKATDFLADWQAKSGNGNSMFASIDPTEVAWRKSGHSRQYSKVRTGDDKPVPDVTIKVPTGGGKTLLACHMLAEIQRLYVSKLHGLVVWLVPTHQIYKQTHDALSSYDHPYRVALENSLGLQPEQINITERGKPLTSGDLSSRLTIMMLMLQAANTRAKENRRMYRDTGSLAPLFPSENNLLGHQRLVEGTGNLDKQDSDHYNDLVISSLANLFRKERPLVIVDEGHKAYSEKARETILDFNPSFLLQLSATPKAGANVLSTASGRDLDNEQMIKMPIHVSPARSEPDWRDTMRRAKAERAKLEGIALEHQQKTGRNIRPICLVQVERTGKDQVEKRHIHAEHVKEFLMNECSVSEEQIAIKSSEKDDIEGIDLLSDSCPIRFVLTKNALQEGWDCAFAYILVVLTSPSSNVGLTQLVGRILRQPDALKTGVPELDKCRVFSYSIRADKLLKDISRELEREGLGDINDRIILPGPDTGYKEVKPSKPRLRKQKYSGRLFLPIFAAKHMKKWDLLDFENDILADVDWTKINARNMAAKISIEGKKSSHDYLTGLPGEKTSEVTSAVTNPIYLDAVVMSQDLQTVIPNAWLAYDFADSLLSATCRRYGKNQVAINYSHISAEAKKLVAKSVDDQCKDIFLNKVGKGSVSFRLLEHQSANPIGNVQPVPSAHKFTLMGKNPAKGLLTFYDERDFNSLEADVAYCFEGQERLLWWHRMSSGAGYSIRGWRKNKIYPDFLATRDTEGSNTQATINVIETKGIHLKNEDTAYKQQIFDICNEISPVSKGWADLAMGFSEHKFVFKIIYDDEWRNMIYELFGPAN